MPNHRRMHPTFFSGTTVNGQIRHLLGIVIDIGINGSRQSRAGPCSSLHSPLLHE